MTPKAGDHSWEKQVELIIPLFSISSPFLADLDTVLSLSWGVSRSEGWGRINSFLTVEIQSRAR